jgi:hypothetical protein
MICPLDHEDEDYRFGTARTDESIVLRICPKCGIVFVPGVKEQQFDDEQQPDSTKDDKSVLPPEKQILKWP